MLQCLPEHPLILQSRNNFAHYKEATILGKVMEKTQGFYTVLSEDTKTQQQVKLIGSLKRANDRLNCVPGDSVRINEIEGTIQEIFPRKNLFLRPLIANVDKVLIVLSAKEPDLALDTLYKLLFQTYYNSALPIIVITKCDLLTASERKTLTTKVQFLTQIEVPAIFLHNSGSSEELSLLKEFISNSVSTTAGPSGVGKSTLINRLQTQREAATGVISGRLKRGKHTTTLSTLMALDEKTYICDTPGFLSLNLPEITDVFQLLSGMPFLETFFGKCKYNNCTHTNEPHCFFKKSVEEHPTLQPIYDFYLTIYSSIFQKRR